MSNLSELLPAGAGAKSASFVASGTLASGQTVALKTNGQVEAVGLTPAALGAETTFDSATGFEGYFSSTYDSVNNKIVIAGRVAAQSYKAYAYVGTISGTSITFGTPVQFTSGTQRANGSVAITYDVASGNVVIFWSNIENSNYATAIVGTVSGTSISFGSPVVFDSSGVTFSSVNSATATYHSGQNVCVLSYRNSAGTLSTIACSVSGTTPTFGSQVVVGGTAYQSMDNVYDVSADRIVTSGQLGGDGRMVLSSCSGTTMTTRATDLAFNSGTNYTALAYDPINEKTVVVYSDTSNSSKGSARVCTVSASSVSFGTEVVFQASGTSEWISAAYDASAQKIVVASSSAGNSDSGQIYVGTVSGTDISFSGQLAFNGTSVTNRIRATYATTAKQTCISYVDYGNGTRGSAILYSNIGANSADFIGITDQAIANTATGAVIVQGGVATNPIGPYALTVGSPNQFTSSTLTDPYTQVVYDSLNNKIVVLYRDSSNSDYGTAIVGTVSGTSISYGSPVIFEAAQSVLISATYDSNSNKVVVCYRDGGNSSYGTAIVGTVSGTSISFGTAAVFQSSSVSYVSSVQDSDTNKTIIAYRDNFNDGKSIVGTVSGTSISFGSAAIFNSGAVQYVSIGYDATNSRAVIAYENGTNGKAIVGTVSGTSISFGSAVTFLSGSESLNTTTTFDPSSGKVLIRYDYFASSAYQGTFGIVGTVSGTSISFGSEQYAFGAGYAQTSTDAVYDPDLNKIILVASTSENSYAGGSIVATISGTSVSFGAFNLFDSARTNYNSIAYDTTSNKSIIAYGADTTGGECLVGTASNALTIGTDYFVQTDGSLSTTTSTVPAGRALSATSILLEG